MDYLRDGSVQLPFSIPRGQLIKDFDFVGLAYTEESFTLSMAESGDLFQGIAEYQSHLAEVEKEIEDDIRSALTRKVACKIAFDYLRLASSSKRQNSLYSPRPHDVPIYDPNPPGQTHEFACEEIDACLQKFGLSLCQGIQWNQPIEMKAQKTALVCVEAKKPSATNSTTNA